MSFKFYCYLQSRYRGGQYEVMNLSLFEAVKTEISTIALAFPFLSLLNLFTDPLFPLQSLWSARDKKQKARGVY